MPPPGCHYIKIMTTFAYMTVSDTYQSPECVEIAIGTMDVIAESVGGSIDPVPWLSDENGEFAL